MTIKRAAQQPKARSRRRLAKPLKKKVFIYVTDEEHATLEKAAIKERSSISGFVAKAAMDKALHDNNNHKK